MKNDDLIALFVSINALRDSLQNITEDLNNLQNRIVEVYEREFDKK